MPDTPNQDGPVETESAPPPASPVSRTYGPYGDALPKRKRERLAQMSVETDLQEEIQLMRFVIEELLRQPHLNVSAVSSAMAMLCRCVNLQIKAARGGSLDEMLTELANNALIELEGSAE